MGAMIGKQIESYADYWHYVHSNRWYLAMARINEFKQRNPEKYAEYRQMLELERGKSKSLGYRIESKK